MLKIAFHSWAMDNTSGANLKAEGGDDGKEDEPYGFEKDFLSGGQQNLIH